MDRGSSKHSPRVDDELAEEVRGVVQGTTGARAEEWKMSEPSGEDQPETTAVPDDGYGLGEPDGVGNPAAEEFSRFASYIGRSSMPGDRAAIERSARDLDAPDDVLAIIAALPEGTTFQNVTEVWASRGEQQ